MQKVFIIIAVVYGAIFFHMTLGWLLGGRKDEHGTPISFMELCKMCITAPWVFMKVGFWVYLALGIIALAVGALKCL